MTQRKVGIGLYMLCFYISAAVPTHMKPNWIYVALAAYMFMIGPILLMSGGKE